MAAGLGFEPRQTESESAVLPLHNPALNKWCEQWDLNPYVVDTRPSNVPVCQFQHARIYFMQNIKFYTSLKQSLSSLLEYYTPIILICQEFFSVFWIFFKFSLLY